VSLHLFVVLMANANWKFHTSPHNFR
jgi:hypothetical protein